MNIDRIVATCLCIGGIVANTIGTIIGLVTFNPNSIISIINVSTTIAGLFVLIIFSIFCFKNKAYSLLNFVIVIFFSCILFPIILLSSPEGVFISYLSLLAPAVGLLHYKFKKYYIVGIVTLVIYWIMYSLKIHLGVNMTSSYMRYNYLHFLGGITATYIFSLLTTTWSTLKLTFFLEKDALTGVQNRYSFEKDINNRDIKFAVMIDIDHFKQVNDIHGHKVGDLVLKSLCDIITMYVSEELKLYRYGGEEFVILSTQSEMNFMTSLKGIWIALNWQLTFKDESFSVSMGVAEKTKVNEKTLIVEADEQLYKAKENGRHQVYYKDKVLLYK